MATKPTARRIPELDSLRGIAAMIVVLYHFTAPLDRMPWIGFSVPWGHFGVELFFIISGYVIFMTLDRAKSIGDFIVSRVARLYPAFWACVICTALVVGVLEQAPSRGEILGNLTMVPPLAGSW